jgi:hypothetical protein
MWLSVATALALSFVSFVISKVAAGSPNADIWDEVHENLNVGTETNLPTWLASVLWAVFALTALYRWHVASTDRTSWLLLSLVGWGASIDEYLMLHDRLSRPGARIETLVGIDLGGATWVLVGGAVAAIVVAVLVPFVWRLPPATRSDLILGGALFIAGSIGFEVVSNLLFASSDQYDWLVMLTVLIEEGLEFAGVVVATRGLLRLPPTPRPETADRRVAPPEGEPTVRPH